MTDLGVAMVCHIRLLTFLLILSSICMLTGIAQAGNLQKYLNEKASLEREISKTKRLYVHYNGQRLALHREMIKYSIGSPKYNYYKKLYKNASYQTASYHSKEQSLKYRYQAVLQNIRFLQSQPQAVKQRPTPPAMRNPPQRVKPKPTQPAQLSPGNPLAQAQQKKAQANNEFNKWMFQRVAFEKQFKLAMNSRNRYAYNSLKWRHFNAQVNHFGAEMARCRQAMDYWEKIYLQADDQINNLLKNPRGRSQGNTGQRLKQNQQPKRDGGTKLPDNIMGQKAP